MDKEVKDTCVPICLITNFKFAWGTRVLIFILNSIAEFIDAVQIFGKLLSTVNLWKYGFLMSQMAFFSTFKRTVACKRNLKYPSIYGVASPTYNDTL